jgi:AraC family transcriptional regulator of adaptative response / DNA-3-methyladenine glycosylase II
VGSRHLARLFREHLGTTPVAVAQTRRVHFARNLVEQTELPMAQVALAAGFGSLRRFNTLVKTTFGDTPTGLRRRTRRDATAGFTCRLPFRPPYDWDGLLAFLGARALPGVEEVVDGTYRRTIRWGEAAGTLAVSRPAPDHLLLALDLPRLDGAIALVDRVRRMFDCGADPSAVGAHLGTDALLAGSVARRPGLRLPCAWDPFELAVRAVIGQQISVAGARTIAGRVAARCGDEVDGPLDRLFPTPEQLATADLDGLGLTGRRIATLQGLARAVAAGDVDLTAPLGPDEFAARLCALPGIGPWTAQYVAMRALGEPDAFPAADLGLVKAAPDIDLLARAEAWRPWRAYAALHLWASLGDEP